MAQRVIVAAVRAARASTVGSLAVLALLPSGAWGAKLEPGVHIDPGSPAAKQYVLPLAQARETGRGSGERSSSPQLFGAGIAGPKPPRSNATAKGTGTAARGGSSSSRGTSQPGASGPSSSRLGRTPPEASVFDLAARRGSGQKSLLMLLGGGIAVLALGGIGAAAVRRSRRSAPSA
jgi:hypothetical protein